MSQDETPKGVLHLPAEATPQSLEDKPRWRRDFPIDWPEDDYVSRRELVKFIVLTSGAFAAGQLWLVFKGLFERKHGPSEKTPIAGAFSLEIGGAKTFEYPKGSTPRLLVRTGPKAFVAYDQQCTHLQCPVVPAVDKGMLHCPCHNGWFDLSTGRPVAGPPRRRLPRVSLEVHEDAVFATGVEVTGS